MTVLTPTRRAALEMVASGDIHVARTPAGVPYFECDSSPVKPAQAPLRWLHDNGLIEPGEVSPRATGYVVTSSGRASLAPKLSDARRSALHLVAQGQVTEQQPLKGKPFFKVHRYWQKPAQAPYLWLIEEGFIRRDSVGALGTTVVLTQAGTDAVQLTAAPDREVHSA